MKLTLLVELELPNDLVSYADGTVKQVKEEDVLERAREGMKWMFSSGQGWQRLVRWEIKDFDHAKGG